MKWRRLVWVPAAVVVGGLAVEFWVTGRTARVPEGREGAGDSGVLSVPAGDGGEAAGDGEAWRGIQKLVRDLSNSDLKVRRDAEKRLAELPEEQRGDLRAAEGDVEDAKARQAIEKRLAEMDEYFVLHLPPVSLHVQGEHLAEILAELNGQLGTEMQTITFQTVPHPVFTVDMEKQPFWEVMTALNRQHAIWIPEFKPDKRFMIYDGEPGIDGPPGMEHAVVQGPFVVYARWVHPQGKKPDEHPVPMLALTVAADPRLHIVEETQTAEVTTDDLKLKFHHTDNPTPRWEVDSQFATANAYTVYVAPGHIEGGGKTIMSIKEHVTIVVSLTEVETDLQDAESYDGKSVTLGKTTVSIAAKRQDPAINQQLIVALNATSATTKPYITATMFDPTGLQLYKFGGLGRAGGSTGIRLGPYRMHLSAPQKVKEFHLDFEVAGLEVPQ